jgi:hypothetical protein
MLQFLAGEDKRRFSLQHMNFLKTVSFLDKITFSFPAGGLCARRFLPVGPFCDAGSGQSRKQWTPRPAAPGYFIFYRVIGSRKGALAGSPNFPWCLWP